MKERCAEYARSKWGHLAPLRGLERGRKWWKLNWALIEEFKLPRWKRLGKDVLTSGNNVSKTSTVWNSARRGQNAKQLGSSWMSPVCERSLWGGGQGVRRVKTRGALWVVTEVWALMMWFQGALHGFYGAHPLFEFCMTVPWKWCMNESKGRDMHEKGHARIWVLFWLIQLSLL